MGRIFTTSGKLVCHIETLAIVGELNDGALFSAVVSGDCTVIRHQRVTLETDEGDHHAAEIDHAEVVSNDFGSVVKIRGKLLVGGSE